MCFLQHVTTKVMFVVFQHPPCCNLFLARPLPVLIVALLLDVTWFFTKLDEVLAKLINLTIKIWVFPIKLSQNRQFFRKLETKTCHFFTDNRTLTSLILDSSQSPKLTLNFSQKLRLWIIKDCLHWLFDSKTFQERLLQLP